MGSTDRQSKDKLTQQIRLEEIRLLYGGTPFSYTASFIIIFLIFSILYDQVASVQNLILWLVIIVSVMLIRSIESYRFAKHKKNKHEQQKNGWRTRFFIGTGIAGLCWGLLPWLGYPDNVEYLAFIIICQIGVIAGSLSTLSYRWESLALFLLPSSLLLIMKLATETNGLSNATSFVLVVFIIFSLSAGNRIFINTQQNIRLRLAADNRERAIQLMHQKQALHLQNTPLAIIDFDIDFNISEWNTAAEKIFGYSRKEALNESVMRLILPRETSDESEKLWQRLLNYEAVIGTVIENKTRSGAVIICQWFITPLTDNNNDIVGISAMALDISEKKNNELALIKSKEEAEKANQAKSDFLSNMSHELRTPLNAILGFTQLLKYEKTLSKKQQSHINEISNAGNLLLALVNQILDLASIEKGNLQLTTEKINLHDILEECHAMVLPLTEKNNLSLSFVATNDYYINADYTRLKQVMLNLLSNAIKYNVANGSVNFRAEKHINDIIRICITDTGTGISEKMLPDIFQAFNRVSTTNNIEGTGIGLSISKQLIEMMGGSISVSSVINQGSEFCIEISGGLYEKTASKIIAEDNRKTSESHQLPHTKATLNYKILVAEDNPINQTLILNQLETLGYKADLVKNGQEALDQLLDNTYQLLLTDCNMPVVDGYELAKTIREGGNTNLPIIALTADAFPEKKERCFKAGMNDQIIKPVDLDTLKRALEKHLKD